MGLQDERDLPMVKDDASDDTETSSGGVNKKRHLNMYDLVSAIMCDHMIILLLTLQR